MSEKKPEEQRISSVPPFGLRMLPELRQRLERAAEANGRSLNSEIVVRLIETLAQDDYRARPKDDYEVLRTMRKDATMLARRIEAFARDLKRKEEGS